MDIRELHRRAVESTGKVVDGLTDAQLDLPTPCTEWTARDVIEHMVDNNHRVLADFAGAPLERAETDPRRAYWASADALAAAFTDDALLEKPYELGDFGTFTGAVALAVHFADVLVHGWDLGRAAGVEVRLDEDLVEQALRQVSRYPDAPGMRGPGKLFAERRAVADDADPQERLLAITGRPASWSAA